MHYAVLTYHPGTGPTAEFKTYRLEIFRGKTQLAAMNRAREHIIAETGYSREEYEEEQGHPVTDEEFLEELDRGGFHIIPATMNTD